MAEETLPAVSESEKKKEDWMNSKWRPMMGWLYMATCTFDFVIFPVLWSLLQAVTKIGPITQWQPLTLQGAGLYHIAMGAVLGLAAFGRTQEKLAGANNGGIQAPGTGFPSGPSTFGQPAPGGFGSSSGFNSPAPASTGFGGNSGFGAPASAAPSWGTTPTAGGFGSTPSVSKPAPSRPPLDEKFPPLD
jgi:hypothetical protein